jgi:23S rRNA pseudouridine1911/1915/1917 synthase
MLGPLPILYEDNHLLVVNKPAGWPTTHDSGCGTTVDQWVKGYLKRKYSKPGQVFLGIVHRLDKPVSGVLLFARTSKAAARLSQQFRLHQVEKIYWAVVSHPLSLDRNGIFPCEGAEFELRDSLLLDDSAARVRVVPDGTPNSCSALTLAHLLARSPSDFLLELRPQTGRKHQLRVQLASRGWPIIGDQKYGSDRRFPVGIALHARKLTFRHPVRHEMISIEAELPAVWMQTFGHFSAETQRQT